MFDIIGVSKQCPWLQTLLRRSAVAWVTSCAIAGCSEGPIDSLDSQQFAVGVACARIEWGQVSGRYLDAYTQGNGDVVTRTQQNDGTQLWCFTNVGVQTYTIRHRTFQGQFLDAYEDANHDYRVVLRDAQFESNGRPHLSQQWLIVGTRIEQLSSSRYLDGYPSSEDNRAITRGFQDDNTQAWLIDPAALPPPAPSAGPAPGP